MSLVPEGVSTSNFIFSQAIGLIILGIVVYAFQTKDKSKTLWLLTGATVLGVVANILLLNWSIIIILAINIFRFPSFAILEKHEDKKELRVVVLVFFLVVTAAAMAIVTVVADLHWFNWILMVGTLLSIYGQWAKGVHLIRITNIVVSTLLIINAVMFMNIMGMLIETFVIISIIVFYVRFFKGKEKGEQNESEQDEDALIS